MSLSTLAEEDSKSQPITTNLAAGVSPATTLTPSTTPTPSVLTSTTEPTKLDVKSLDDVELGVEAADKKETISVTASNDGSHHIDPSFVRVKLTRLQFVLVYVALALSIFLGALDQTIVATALRAIVEDLGGETLIPWIGSAFLLATTSVAALYGKFADIFGRKITFLFALIVFEAGSLVCGIAPSMEVLVVGRAVAGLGAGGIFSLVMIIISDIVSIQDRGKYQGILGAVFGVASVVGPLMGGAFSDHVSWRWCFYINLPIGAVTVVAVIFLLKFPRPEGDMRHKLARIDFLGALLLTAAVCCLITPLQLGGTTWAWSAPQTIVLFVLSVILFVALFFVETRVAKEPIIPPAMFVNSSVTAFLVIAVALGAAFFSAVYYISLFFQISYGDTATQAGLETIPLVMGLVLMSIASGQIVSRTGYYVPFIYVGGVLLCVGLGLISILSPTSARVEQVFFLLIAGLGAGCIIQIRVLGLQASVDGPMIAIATAVSQFSQSLGGSVGVAITGTVYQNILASNIKAKPELSALLASQGVDPAQVNLPILRTMIEGNALLLGQLVDAFAGAFQIAYRASLPFPIVILVAALFLRNYMVKAKPGAAAAAAH
ncbi:hypothetical protein HK101_008335 [Irineochytrium annulatum]|nr:hypothetical protein HK101_008335 [Irineochytrium annulatum]